MIENNFTALEDMLKHFNSNEGGHRGGKISLAFCLSVLSFFLIFLLVEGFGAWALFLGMGAYFFIAQYLLSRGNALSVRNDWPIIIALNSAPTFMTVLSLAFESNKKAALPVLGVVVLGLACSYAGAAFAKRCWRSS
jgi:hypothetical protein